MGNALAAVLATTLALSFDATARAATIKVDSLTDTGAPGICVLRDAITAANTMTATNGCTAGTGNDTIQFSVTGTISLASTLPQITDHLLAINGPASAGITLNGGGQVQVMQVVSGSTVSVNGLTIAHSFNSNDTIVIAGAAIDNEGTMTITSSVFSDNRSAGYGGAIYNNGVMKISNSTFFGNSAIFLGAGIVNDFNGKLTVVNSTISENTTGSPGSLGGGTCIYNAYGGKATVTQTAFSHNIRGCILTEGSLTVAKSTFSRNTGMIGYGGAIAAGGTALTVSDSTFSENTTQSGGGGAIGQISGRTIVIRSTFSGNSSENGGGGAIAGAGGILVVINSTFSQNTASFSGGGIVNGFGGTLSVTNSTFSGNSSGSGGAVADSRPGLFSVKSSVMSGSIGGDCDGTIIDFGYNISEDSSCGFTASGSLNNTDPMLDPAGLASNGGPTQTIALLSGSPAIDAIPVADCTDQASPPNPIITDQRGFPRPDGGETNCDIGAYEVQDTAFVPFSHFHGGLKIDPNAGFFSLSGGFKLGRGGSIDPTTQSVSFGIGSYAIRLPVGSFFKVSNGYVYQKKVNGVFLCLYIKLTDTLGSYALLAIERGVTPASTILVPVTLTIGDDSGSTQMKAKFD